MQMQKNCDIFFNKKKTICAFGENKFKDCIQIQNCARFAGHTFQLYSPRQGGLLGNYISHICGVWTLLPPFVSDFQQLTDTPPPPFVSNVIIWQT